MNISIIKPSIAVWMFLATSSLQAWQVSETVDGNTAEDTAAAPLEYATPLSPDEPGVLNKQVHTIRSVESGSITITWLESNDYLGGFSNTLGEWDTLKIERQSAIVPIVGTNVAAVRIGDSIAAFSGSKGWWNVISLSKDSAAQPAVSSDLVYIEDNGHIYTFAAAKGRWTSPTDPELQSAVAEIKGTPKSMNLAVGPFTKWLDSLPRYKARGIRDQFSSGSGSATIYTDRQSTLEEAKLKVSELLQSNEITVDEDNAEPPSKDEVRPDIESRIARLRSELQLLDVSLRAGSEKIDPNSPKKDEEKQALQTRVEQAFDARQELQRLEAQRMRLKLQTIEANLDAREKNREDIIQQRVNELLDSHGKLTGQGAGDKTTPEANPGMPATETPIGLPGTPALPDGGPAGLASHLAPNTNARIQWLQPAEIVFNLRSYMEARRGPMINQKGEQLLFEQWSKPLQQLQSEGIATPEMTEAQRQALVDSINKTRRSYESAADGYLRDWKQAWASYQTQLRLLKLDVDEAKLAVEQMQRDYEQWVTATEERKIARMNGEIAGPRYDVDLAKINLQRAEELLKLYADIETQQPELNPDSLESEK